MLCACCGDVKAQTRAVSMFRLCAQCAYRLCPKTDTRRYHELRLAYGWDRHVYRQTHAAALAAHGL